MKLHDATWTELVDVVATSALVIPIGSTEQHGPHLPLNTDTTIATALADLLVAQRPGITVAPALPYGSSGEHAGFAGTLSIGGDALAHVIVELVRSADDFARVVLLSGHGGNAEAIERAVALLRSEGRKVVAWSPSGPFDAHAGHSETSLMLALAPASVRTGALQPGNTTALAELLPTLRSHGVASVAPNGVLGDPTAADACHGHDILERMVADLLETFDRFVAGG